MASIVAGDLLWKYSVTSGTTGNTTAGTAAGSLGKYISTTAVSSTTLNDLFDDITPAENAASTVDYRLIFLHNNHATYTYTSPFIYLSSETAGGASISISVDTTGVTAKGSAAVQAKTIANETTAPSTQSFSAPTSFGTGLAMSDIPAGSVQGIWVKRTAANTAALALDGVVLTVQGNTT